MTQSVAIDIIKPRLRETNAPNILPGSPTIGSGYDVFGQYCAPDGVQNQIIDLGDFTDSSNISGLRTSPMVRVTEAKSGIARQIEGKTLSEYSTNFSSKVGIKGKYGFFKGELDAAFDTSQSRKTTTRFVVYNLSVYFYKLRLDSSTSLRDKLTPAAAHDFAAGMDADELVKTYGTHYLSNLIIGARCSYSCTVDTTNYKSSVDLSTAAKVNFESLTGSVSGDVTADQKKAAESLHSHSVAKARVFGGDPVMADNILKRNLESWTASVPKNMQFADCSSGLLRISELVADPGRAADINEAIDQVLNSHELPGAPNIVPITSFHTSPPSRWYYTAKPEERPSGFGPMGIPFFGFNTPQDGTVPIYSLSAAKPERFMLSTDKSSRAGWANATVAFHAYPGPSADDSRVRVNAYTCDTTRSKSGWHYTTADKVKGWSRDNSNTFYAPKV